MKEQADNLVTSFNVQLTDPFDPLAKSERFVIEADCIESDGGVVFFIKAGMIVYGCPLSRLAEFEAQDVTEVPALLEESNLPLYRSHKIVAGAEITAIATLNTGHAHLQCVGPEEEPETFMITVGKAYMDKHTPAVGGYYVRYGSGYESWSPAPEFEAGYINVR